MTDERPKKVASNPRVSDIQETVSVCIGWTIKKMVADKMAKLFLIILVRSK